MTEKYIIKNNGSKLDIFTPYNAEFVKRVKQLSGARWNGADKCWQVSAAAEDAIREIMREIYGRDDRPTETVTVRIRIPQEKIEWTGPVVIWGKTLSSASGRDSGARTGASVSLVTGSINSGGSVKNWKSIIESGAEFIIESVPATSVEIVPEWIEIISITRDGIDLEALHTEKEKLLARIAEIDAILATN